MAAIYIIVVTDIIYAYIIIAILVATIVVVSILILIRCDRGIQSRMYALL